MSALQSVSRAFRAWGARADVTRVLHDGESVELRDRTFEVFHRPGHSPTDTVFLDAERRMLLAADHLLTHISSNPLITRAERRLDRPPRGAGDLSGIARATREMELDLVLPGHGDPITDHRALIDERFALHRRRAEKLHRLIAERPRSAYELAQSLWGNIAVTQAYLTPQRGARPHRHPVGRGPGARGRGGRRGALRGRPLTHSSFQLGGRLRSTSILPVNRTGARPPTSFTQLAIRSIPSQVDRLGRRNAAASLRCSENACTTSLRDGRCSISGLTPNARAPRRRGPGCCTDGRPR